jgi:hypothetical protein
MANVYDKQRKFSLQIESDKRKYKCYVKIQKIKPGKSISWYAQYISKELNMKLNGQQLSEIVAIHQKLCPKLESLYNNFYFPKSVALKLTILNSISQEKVAYVIKFDTLNIRKEDRFPYFMKSQIVKIIKLVERAIPATNDNY